MILEHIYRLSLEEPHHWALFFGPPVSTHLLTDPRIDMLSSYIEGLRQGTRLRSEAESDWDSFLDWLGEHNEFPTCGWPQRNLDKSDGDHMQAIARFWGLLHRYVLSQRPEWFQRLNQSPLPSKIANIHGPILDDIRLPKHIRVAKSKPQPTRKKTPARQT